jgi:hypothetical protein
VVTDDFVDRLAGRAEKEKVVHCDVLDLHSQAGRGVQLALVAVMRNQCFLMCNRGVGAHDLDQRPGSVVMLDSLGAVAK